MCGWRERPHRKAGFLASKAVPFFSTTTASGWEITTRLLSPGERGEQGRGKHQEQPEQPGQQECVGGEKGRTESSVFLLYDHCGTPSGLGIATRRASRTARTARTSRGTHRFRARGERADALGLQTGQGLVVAEVDLQSGHVLAYSSSRDSPQGLQLCKPWLTCRPDMPSWSRCSSSSSTSCR